MEESLKLNLLSKLITENEIAKQLTLRKRAHIYQKIDYASKDTYLELGWEVDKEFKSSVTVKKLKSNDVDFEDKIWTLFALLDYKIQNKDRHFHLPYDKTNPSLTQQIDVFAKDDETILLIECKSASENKRGDFKKELEAMTAKMAGLRKSIQALFPDAKCKVKFILATRNYSISEDDLKRLEKIGGIHLNEENIDYFYSLYNQIGIAAKYQFLSNIFFDQDIPELDGKVPAVEGKMGGYTYYSFSIEPEKLLKISYVLHRNKANVNMMPTYQRLIKNPD